MTDTQADTRTDLLLPDILRLRAQESADRPFLQPTGERAHTYGAVYAHACAIANGLVELGVQHGECVVIMAENTVDSICTWLAINLAGAVEAAINTGYRGHSLEHALQNTRARLILIEAALLPRLAEVRDSLTYLETVVVYGSIDAAPELPGLELREVSEILGTPDAVPRRTVSEKDLASIVYTSGTTGPGKGVMMPHGQIRLFARLGVEGARMTGEDAFYCFVPLYHVAGKFIGILGSMMTGGKVILDSRFSAPDWLPRVREYGATLCLLHGPLVEMIYKLPESSDDHDNPVTRIMASPFPAKIAVDFERRFGLRGIETWGMTEVTIPIWQPYEEPLHVGCCGRLREEHFELRIADPDTDAPLPAGEVGELTLRPCAPWTMMQGYLHRPEATVAAWRNLWFHTGDLGYVDEQGYVYFVDRMTERIRRRAENISSYEIEAAAREHPAMLDCAAVGVPSEFEGDDDVMLWAILAEGTTLEPTELIEHLVKRLPHFMVPRYVRFTDGFPRTPTGKVRKALMNSPELLEEAWDRKTAGVSIRELAM